MFYVLASSSLIPGVLTGFFWHKRMGKWWRQFGAVMLVLLPAFVLLGLGLWERAVDGDHFMHDIPPGEYFSHFNVAVILTMMCAPGWALGVLFGYMFRSLKVRPLRF